MSGSTYILEGRDSELAQHSGHQIEVTGTLSPSASSTGSTSGAASGAPSAASTTTSGTTTASGGSSAGSMASASQHIEVTSVRMIASSCAK
jgi:hypothetical protein